MLCLESHLCPLPWTTTPLQSSAAAPSLAVLLRWHLHEVLWMPVVSVPLTANGGISSEPYCFQLILLFVPQPPGSHWDPTLLSLEHALFVASGHQLKISCATGKPFQPFTSSSLPRSTWGIWGVDFKKIILEGAPGWLSRLSVQRLASAQVTISPLREFESRVGL